MIESGKPKARVVPARLRHRAERQLVHELEVHRIELEMQNEELRSAQQALELSRDRYAHLYDFAPVAYATFDSDGRALEVNLTLASTLGVERARLVDRPFVGFVTRPNQQAFLRHVRDCIRDKQAAACELELVCKNGTAPVELHSTFADSAEHGAVCRTALSSIADRRKAEQATLLARQAAEDANEAKTRFLANVSHELRTPMSAILGLTELALGETLTGEVRGYLTTVEDAATKLLQLINELLDVARVEAGQHELNCGGFVVRSVVSAVIALLERSAVTAGLTLTASVDPQVPERVVGDAERIRQILINLLGNAIKYTERGTIELRVTCPSRSAEHVDLVFAVTDTGVGIAPEVLQRVFERFTQADASDARAHGGTGLGLTIAASLAKMMGGRIRAESKPGRGSTFSLTLRLQRATGRLSPRDGAGLEPRDAQQLPAQPAQTVRVLVVEDSAVLQAYVKVVLQKRGHSVTVADDGAAALDLLSVERFDLVLMDVQMPNMDGFAATASIRSLTDPKTRRVPIVAMTAHAMAGDREHCLAAGMDEYLAKPIRSRDLIEVVERLAGKQQRSTHEEGLDERRKLAAE